MSPGNRKSRLGYLTRGIFLLGTFLVLVISFGNFSAPDTSDVPGTAHADPASVPVAAADTGTQVFQRRPEHRITRVEVRVWDYDSRRPHGVIIDGDSRDLQRTIPVRRWEPRPPSYETQLPVVLTVDGGEQLVDRVTVSTIEAYEETYLLPALDSLEHRHEIILPPTFEVSFELHSEEGLTGGELEVESLSIEFPGALVVDVDGQQAHFCLRREGYYQITWRPETGAAMKRRLLIAGGQQEIRF